MTPRREDKDKDDVIFTRLEPPELPIPIVTVMQAVPKARDTITTTVIEIGPNPSPQYDDLQQREDEEVGDVEVLRKGRVVGAWRCG